MSKRVLVVTHNYPRFRDDPAGAFVARLAWSVADAGWEVRVVAPHSPATPERERDQGLVREATLESGGQFDGALASKRVEGLYHAGQIAVLKKAARGAR